jgi:hypothetical protein
MEPLLLDAGLVLKKADKLHQRIEERFRGRKLCDTSKRVLDLTEQAGARAKRLGKPNWLMRTVLFLFLAAAVGAAGYAVYMLHLSLDVRNITDFLQGLGAALDALVLLAAGVYFILSADLRIKRSSALKALHELRSLAHVVDMHQFDKDPERLWRAKERDTKKSPQIEMDAFLLERYLDYCDELLGIISKIAALYAQHLRDEVSLRSVDEIEDLTSGLRQQIGQKLERIQAAGMTQGKPARQS